MKNSHPAHQCGTDVCDRAGTISAKPANTPPGKTSNVASPKGPKEKKLEMKSIKSMKSRHRLRPAKKKTKLMIPHLQKQRAQTTAPPIKRTPRTKGTKDTRVC